MNMGDRIKQLRIEHGLTQTELGKYIGVQKSAIRKYEKGEVQNMKRSTIQILSNLFNVAPTYLMCLDDENTNNNESIKRDTFANRLHIVLSKKNMKPVELSRKTGISRGSISNYLMGKFEPKEETISIIANILEVSPSWLMGFDVPMKKSEDIDEITSVALIPIIGEISAGEPIVADERIQGYLPIDTNIISHKEIDDLFFLIVEGNSMNKVFSDKSYILVKKQYYADDNDIIVALINNEVTVKKFKTTDNRQFITLLPESTYEEFQPKIIDLKDNDFKILGKVIGNFNVNL